MRRFIDSNSLALYLICICSLMWPTQDQAQSQSSEPAPQNATSALPSFEVAAIKPNRSGDPGYGMSAPLGRFEAKNISVEELVERAYYLPADRISGGPNWFDSTRYDIEAKMSDSQIQEMEKSDKSQQENQLHLMLQSMLTDRFKLRVSHRAKELNSYALIVAKGGPKLRVAGTPEPTEPSSPIPSGGFPMIWFEQRNCTPGALAGFLQDQFHRPVTDQTGLKGSYDIKFVVPIDPEGDRESQVRSALQDQLGLKVTAQKATVDAIFIEQVEAPSANRAVAEQARRAS